MGRTFKALAGAPVRITDGPSFTANEEKELTDAEIEACAGAIERGVLVEQGVDEPEDPTDDDADDDADKSDRAEKPKAKRQATRKPAGVTTAALDPSAEKR